MGLIEEFYNSSVTLGSLYPFGHVLGILVKSTWKDKHLGDLKEKLETRL